MKKIYTLSVLFAMVVAAANNLQAQTTLLGTSLPSGITQTFAGPAIAGTFYTGTSNRAWNGTVGTPTQVPASSGSFIDMGYRNAAGTVKGLSYIYTVSGANGCTTLGIPYGNSANFPPNTNTPIVGINGYNPSGGSFTNQFSSGTAVSYVNGAASAVTVGPTMVATPAAPQSAGGVINNQLVFSGTAIVSYLASCCNEVVSGTTYPANHQVSCGSLACYPTTNNRIASVPARVTLSAYSTAGTPLTWGQDAGNSVYFVQNGGISFYVNVLYEIDQFGYCDAETDPNTQPFSINGITPSTPVGTSAHQWVPAAYLFKGFHGVGPINATLGDLYMAFKPSWYSLAPDATTGLCGNSATTANATSAVATGYVTVGRQTGADIGGVYTSLTSPTYSAAPDPMDMGLSGTSTVTGQSLTSGLTYYYGAAPSSSCAYFYGLDLANMNSSSIANPTLGISLSNSGGSAPYPQWNATHTSINTSPTITDANGNLPYNISSNILTLYGSTQTQYTAAANVPGGTVGAVTNVPFKIILTATNAGNWKSNGGTKLVLSEPTGSFSIRVQVLADAFAWNSGN